jgi:hypothetical protein
MLLLLLVLVPLGFAATHIATSGKADVGPMLVAAIYVLMMLAAHFVLVASGQRGDPLLLPLVATIGGVGIIVLNRLSPDLGKTAAFGLDLDLVTTQLLWFGVGVVAMLAVAVFLRDDGILRHYKYSWALAGIALLLFTFAFGTEVNGAKLWIYLGPIGFQPGEFIKLVLVVFIAGYLAEHRTLLRDAVWRLGPIRIPPLPYLLPMLAIFVIVMGVVVFGKDLGTALLFFGIFLTMLFVATGRRSYVLVGLVLFVRGVPSVRARGASHRRVDQPVRRSHRIRLPGRPSPLCVRSRRSVRRGARAVTAADRRWALPGRGDRFHLRRGRGRAGRRWGVRAAGAHHDAGVPWPADRHPRPR